MGRLVRTARTNEIVIDAASVDLALEPSDSQQAVASPVPISTGSATTPASKGAIYADRLIKMIPGEAVALFLAVDGVVKASLPKPGEPTDARIIALAWGVLVVVAALNIGYLRLTKGANDNTRDFLTTAGVGTLAFLIWAYSIQSSVVEITGWFFAPLASVLVILVTGLAPFTAGSLDPADN